METSKLLELIARGEDSGLEFKADVSNEKSLAQELVAFANSNGGILLIGVGDDGSVTGLNSEDMRRINTLLANASSGNVRPSINAQTTNVVLEDGIVMVVSIPGGVSNIYTDNDGVIWIRSGASKRKATSWEEIQRLFQSSGLVHGDGIEVPGMTIVDLDHGYFREFYEKEYRQSLDSVDIPLPQLLANMNLMQNGNLNRSGVLLFSKNPTAKLPVFMIKAVAYPGTDISVDQYIDSQDITGKVIEQYQQITSFIGRNIRYVQNDKGINTVGDPEIPGIVFEELLANAIIHRDYFVSAPIRVFIFKDRIEIISPGSLPNNLTVANIIQGNSNIRNPILASFATKILPYRGLGSGIRRSLQVYPHIEFHDDREGNLFTASIKRPALEDE